MNALQWEARAAALAVEQAARTKSITARAAKAVGLALPTPAQMREAIVELMRLMLSGPESIQQRYKAIDELQLRTLAEAARANLDQGSMAWLDCELVEAAGAQLRAFDRYLLDHGDIRGKPDNPNVDYLCPTSDVHVIPRFAAEQPQPHLVTSRTVRRRGLVWHRLIPRTMGDYTIDLQWHADLSLSFRRTNARVLGALFDGLTLIRDERFTNYVAADAPCVDEDATIAKHVEAAYAGDVTIALWPELTMPKERRAKLRSALKARARECDPGTGPTLIAAGSWHEVDGTTVRNRMHILSSIGQPRFVHDKTLPLESKTLGTEELAPSYRIAVLIAEDALIAFAICRDFCELQITKIYHELDVDLVIVPSYGDIATILAHRQQATNLYTDPGTRAFVVQQIVPEEATEAGVGFILPPTGNPAHLVPDEMRAAPPGQRQPLSFKKV
jgi:hypothetical protein